MAFIVIPVIIYSKKNYIMSTIFIALCIIAFIVLVVGFLRFVHKRDQKAEAAKNKNLP